MITEKDVLVVQHIVIGNTYLMATRMMDNSGLPATPENPIAIEHEGCPYCGAMASVPRSIGNLGPGNWRYIICGCGVKVALRHCITGYIILGVTTQTSLCTVLSSVISVQEDII